ncbi:MAG TPA: hypothetical protein VN683_02015, partial [Acidothermaceae bacterium]|nr:hypothetical protein [Acidothermaceae bacterium]
MTRVHGFTSKHRRHQPSVSRDPAKVLRRRSAGVRGGYGLQVLFVVSAVVFAALVVLPRASV